MQQVNEFESNAIHQQRRQTTETGTVMVNKLNICSEAEADSEFDHGGIRCNRRRSIGGSSTQSSSPSLLLLLPATTTACAVASVSTAAVPSLPADIRKTGCRTSEHKVSNTTTTTHHDDYDDDEEVRKELLLLLEQQNLMRNDFNVDAAYNCHGSDSGISSHCLRFDGVRGTTNNKTTNLSPVPQTVNYDDLSAVIAGNCSHQQTSCWWFGDFGRRRRSTSKNCNCEYHRIIKRSSNTATTFGERLIVATESWKTIQNINKNNAGYAVAYENQEAAHCRQHHHRDDSLGENSLDFPILRLPLCFIYSFRTHPHLDIGSKFLLVI